MTATRRVRGGLVASVIAVVLALTGCVQVPEAGPVEKVPGQSEVCQNCINVEVAPPAPGAGPLEIVQQYLIASSNYQPGYATAKQFLTTTGAAAWQPEVGVLIYDGAPKVDGDRVRLEGRLTGSVGPDRTYTVQDKPLSRDFEMVREKGEWRIDNPPDGLLVSRFAFGNFYTGYSTYFVGNDTSLVPERIYLPALRTPDTIASALMRALLKGPSDWLAPAAESFIPTGTTLHVDSVTINNGTAEVQLDEAILTLADSKRALMAAQILYTLRQVPVVKRVLIKAGEQTFRVPGADPTSLEVTAETLSREIDPVPSVSEQLYAVRAGAVHRVATPDGRPDLQVIDGALGDRRRFPVDSLAVSGNGTDVAAVTNGRTFLRRGDTTNGSVQLLAEGLTGLLRPQFSRYQELWAIGDQDGVQRLWLFQPDGVDSTQKPTVLEPPVPGGRVIAFRVSPDGSRMALVSEGPRGTQLGLARISRLGKITVDGWRPIDVVQHELDPIKRITDVAWLDANELVVLGASSAGEAPTLFRVAADASRIVAEGDAPADWGARELTVLSRPLTFAVVGQGNQSWRKSSGQWQMLLPGVSTLAYAG